MKVAIFKEMKTTDELFYDAGAKLHSIRNCERVFYAKLALCLFQNSNTTTYYRSHPTRALEPVYPHTWLKQLQWLDNEYAITDDFADMAMQNGYSWAKVRQHCRRQTVAQYLGQTDPDVAQALQRHVDRLRKRFSLPPCKCVILHSDDTVTRQAEYPTWLIEFASVLPYSTAANRGTYRD